MCRRGIIWRILYKSYDQGLYYDIKDFSAGKIAYTFDELIEELSMILSNQDLYSEKRKHVRDKFMTYEKGMASENIIQEVILKRNKNKNV